jgi:hypothetical protein
MEPGIEVGDLGFPGGGMQTYFYCSFNKFTIDDLKKLAKISTDPTSFSSFGKGNIYDDSMNTSTFEFDTRKGKITSWEIIDLLKSFEKSNSYEEMIKNYKVTLPEEFRSKAMEINQKLMDETRDELKKRADIDQIGLLKEIEDKPPEERQKITINWGQYYSTEEKNLTPKIPEIIISKQDEYFGRQLTKLEEKFITCLYPTVLTSFKDEGPLRQIFIDGLNLGDLVEKIFHFY